MTDPNYTAISVLLDRSGSMAAIKTDAEGGLREFIDSQRKVYGKCTLRLAQFDTEYETIQPSTSIHDVAYPTLEPRGGTALLDAWGRAMTEFGAELAARPEHERPGHVIFVVVTDGMENSSREWSRDRVFDVVKQQRETYGWEFIFLAANQDAVAEGIKYGVPHTHSITYTPDSAHVHSAYAALGDTVIASRIAGGTTSGFTEAHRHSTQKEHTPA